MALKSGYLFKMLLVIHCTKQAGLPKKLGSETLPREDRDLIIESLNRDNSKLKEMYDQKHDTVFVPKIIYRFREREPDIVNTIE